MRKFLIRNFVGNYECRQRFLRLLSIVFFIPATAAIFALLPGWDNYKWGIAFGVLAALCYFLPVGEKLDTTRAKASRWIYPIFLPTACVHFKFQDIDFSGQWLVWVPLACSIWFGFFHFDVWPLTEDESGEIGNKKPER